jgi:hypothetical protein
MVVGRKMRYETVRKRMKKFSRSPLAPMAAYGSVIWVACQVRIVDPIWVTGLRMCGDKDRTDQE